MKPTIAVDIDDVIADSTEALRLAVNEAYGVNLSPEDYFLNDQGDYWGYYDRVWERNGIKNVSYDKMHNVMTADQSHISLFPGAYPAIVELSKRFKIILVTSRKPAWRKATNKWVYKNFGKILRNVYFAGRFKDGATDKTKGDFCRSLGVSVLIDDNPDHCHSAMDVGVDAILFGDFGWHGDRAKGLTACKDWPAVLEHLLYAKV